MAVSVQTFRRITGTAGFLSFVCFCLDCYRANHAAASLGYLVAVFVADIWGFIPYTLLTLGKKNYSGSGPVLVPQKRTQQILWRLLFFILALIAPCIELVNAGTLNREIKNFTTPQSPESILDKVSEDAVAACWGAVGEGMRAAAKNSADGETLPGTCGALQARTIIMLIVGLLVLVETILYARSNVGTEAWVQEELEKRSSTNAPAEAIQMAPQSHPVVCSASSPPSSPKMLDSRVPDLERGVVQAI